MKYDVRCESCKLEWEISRRAEEPNPACTRCGSTTVTTIWKTVPILEKAKDPYDLLDGKIPGKKIVSGPKYSSKTTV